MKDSCKHLDGFKVDDDIDIGKITGMEPQRLSMVNLSESDDSTYELDGMWYILWVIRKK